MVAELRKPLVKKATSKVDFYRQRRRRKVTSVARVRAYAKLKRRQHILKKRATKQTRTFFRRVVMCQTRTSIPKMI